MPYTSYSTLAHPAPMPISARPPDSRSIAVMALASTAGWRYPIEYTNDPQRTLEVAHARAACMATASRHAASSGRPVAP